MKWLSIIKIIGCLSPVILFICAVGLAGYVDATYFPRLTTINQQLVPNCQLEVDKIPALNGCKVYVIGGQTNSPLGIVRCNNNISNS
jgi:hypothetical protein